LRLLIIAPTVLPLGAGKYGGVELVVSTLVKELAKTQDITVAAPVGSKVPKGVDLIETVNLPAEQDRDDLIPAIVTGIKDYDVIHDFTHRHVFKDRANAIHMCYNPIHIRYDFTSKMNVVCFSDWQRERFEKMYGQKALTMPCNVVDTEVFKPDPGAKRERFLFLGKMSPDKGAHSALRYADELGVPLDIVGGLIPSDSRSFVEYLQKVVSRRNDITLHFNVTEQEKLSFLQNAKALIYPCQIDDPSWFAGVEEW
jgi:glycosyltransferase involved in cell wall biosynthesis